MSARRPTLPFAQMRELQRLRPRRTLNALLLVWGSIALAAGAAIFSGSAAVYAIAIPWIGFRQLALWNILHEGVHGMLLPSRRWNDVVSDLFAALPLVTTTRRYRQWHHAHHRYLGTAADPDLLIGAQRKDRGRIWPRSLAHACCLMLFDLSGITFLRNFTVASRRPDFALLGESDTEEIRKPGGPWMERRELLLFLVPALCGLALVAATGMWMQVLLLWAVPLMTTFQLAQRLHQWGDHFGVDQSSDFPTRHVEAGPVESLLLSPLHSNYHLAHHLYPQVPHYHLPALHELLKAATPGETLPVADGYLLGPNSVLRRIVAADESRHVAALATVGSRQ